MSGLMVMFHMIALLCMIQFSDKNMFAMFDRNSERFFAISRSR